MEDMVRKTEFSSEAAKRREPYNVIPHRGKKVLIFRTIGLLSDFVIAQWREISEKAIKEKGRFTVALSGGSTPVFLYKKLSQENVLPWKKTHIFMVDERFVPYEDDKNNLSMINRTLLIHLNIPKENIHPIATDEKTPAASAAKYEKKLISFFRTSGSGLPQFDLILLGIGEDGHTASLFPQTKSVREEKRLTVAVSPKSKTKKDRITITLPLISNAENIMFLVTGENKAKIVKEVIEKKKSLLPAAMVKPENGRLLFLLDEGAGRLLKNNKEVFYVKGGRQSGEF